jgi:hypothetical protein
MAVAGWLAEGLPGRAAKTIEVYADALRPVLAVAGRIALRDLTMQDGHTALAKMAVTHSTPTLQKAHSCLTRALRHAEGRDLVRRNVSALVGTPRGREGRPSQALTPEQAATLLEAAEDSRLHACMVLCLLPTATPRRTGPGGRYECRRSPSKRCRRSCAATPRNARERGYACGLVRVIRPGPDRDVPGVPGISSTGTPC